MLQRVLSVDEVLTTTRAVRKRLDLNRPVPAQLIRECLDIALQAPTGSNRQGWHFVVVTDPDVRARLAQLYRRSFALYRDSPGSAANVATDDAERAATQQRVASSADHLAEHLHEVPALLVPCITGRAGDHALAQASLYGSVLPAVWSFMLAARARGLGTAWTTLHLRYEQDAAALLGVPYPDVTQVALVPIAYAQDTAFKPAPRAPLDDVLHWDRW
jgi:nitroreductase